MNKALFIPSTDKQKQEICKVTKVGKLHKASRVIKIASIRDNLESKFLTLAKIENRKDERAKAQREQRRAKR